MNSLSPEAITSVVGSIYQAAYDPAEWHVTIHKLRDLLNSSRACIAHTGAAPWRAVATIEDDEFHSSACFAAHMRDPFVAASMARNVGEPFRRYEVIDEVEFKRRELWNDWMLPREMWRSITANLHSDETGVWSVHLHRSKKQSEFDEQDARALRICAEHMIHAKGIRDQIHHVARFGKLFEQLPIGIALVDNVGKVEFLNHQAEAILAGSASIAIKAGRILCEHQATHAKFATLIGSALSSDLERPRGGTLFIQGEPEAGLASIVVSVAPYCGPEYYGLPSQSFAIVILRNIFLQPSTHLDAHMRDLFGLTAAEASLCVVLAGGIPLQEAASRNGITTKTARTYLERIFSKTGTRQQSQLVALIKGARPLM